VEGNNDRGFVRYTFLGDIYGFKRMDIKMSECFNCKVRGICCYQKLDVSKVDETKFLFSYSDPCQHLNKKGFCKIYYERKKKNANCRDITEVIMWYPMCNYNKEFEQKK
jgi:uncharacterized cysteine cluster protein YcgN (CxxCxxCC family)